MVSVSLIAVTTMAVYLFGLHHGRTGEGLAIVNEAVAAETKAPASPVKALSERDVYYPGSEDLAPDEMRVIACGTGMPNARPKQAAACFLVELGNGDKFIFDIGTGSAERISAMKIPYDYLDKIFIGHLHADHFGDLDAMWVGGVLANRQRPLRVWGPSGSEERLGIKHAVKHMEEMFAWDFASRQGNVNTVGFKIEVEEFDYKAVNKVIYQENGVTIRSIPAIHAGDGPVSYILEYADLKIVIGGDTFPNKWYIKHATNADIAIHETFLTPEALVKLYGQSPQQALAVGTQIHTSPQAFGKVMSTIKPRHAIGYHFFNDENTRYGVYDGVRQTYDGPLSLATDNMVWNITKDKINIRMTVSPDAAWAVAGPTKPPKPPARGTVPDPISDYIKAGRWNVNDAQGAMIKEFKKENNMQ
jgi:ribonuclease Z